jgi:threonine dehydrogenase-like Zn-dependent dehydrogenase
VRALTLGGGNLRFDPHHPEPRAGQDEAIVQVHLAGICTTDLRIRDGFMGFSGIPGHEMVGLVTAGTPRWLGRRVVAEVNCPCGKCELCLRGLAKHCRKQAILGIRGRDGFFADFVAVPESNLHEVPGSISDDEAVFVEPLASALEVLAQCPVDARMSVSVVGTGRLGLLVAQVLRSTACRLTAIGRDPAKLEHCDKLGVQGVHVSEVARRNDRDVVVDCSGTAEGFQLATGLVRPRGTLVVKSFCCDQSASVPAADLNSLVMNEVKVIGSRCGSFPQAIAALARKAVEVRSLISRVFSISEGVQAFPFAGQPGVLKVLLRLQESSCVSKNR